MVLPDKLGYLKVIFWDIIWKDHNNDQIWDYFKKIFNLQSHNVQNLKIFIKKSESFLEIYIQFIL